MSSYFLDQTFIYLLCLIFSLYVPHIWHPCTVGFKSRSLWKNRHIAALWVQYGCRSFAVVKPFSTGESVFPSSSGKRCRPQEELHPAASTPRPYLQLLQKYLGHALDRSDAEIVSMWKYCTAWRILKSANIQILHITWLSRAALKCNLQDRKKSQQLWGIIM